MILFVSIYGSTENLKKKKKQLYQEFKPRPSHKLWQFVALPNCSITIIERLYAQFGVYIYIYFTNLTTLSTTSPPTLTKMGKNTHFQNLK